MQSNDSSPFPDCCMTGANVSSQLFLARAYVGLIYLGGLYTVSLLLLAAPIIQRHILFLHKLPCLLLQSPDFHTPHKYWLAPYKAKNLSIRTSDNETLGAWFVLSDAFYRDFSRSFGRPSRPFVEEDIKTSLREYPTVIFFHGNAANRAARGSLYSSVSTRLEANVLVIDYRGFGESTGEPSEAGLLIDARAAWDWLSERGAKPENIIIMGHSLGTSVSALLGEQLASEGIHPRGVVLMAPFTSVFAAARSFTLFKLIPLLRPLASLLEANEAAMGYLRDKLDTQSRIQKIKSTILIIHAVDDQTISNSHSAALFDQLLEPSLPPLPFTVEDPAWRIDEEIWNAATEARCQTRAKLVSHLTIPQFADVREFQRPDAGKVMHVETLSGRHVNILESEGLLDIMDDFFSISCR